MRMSVFWIVFGVLKEEFYIIVTITPSMINSKLINMNFNFKNTLSLLFVLNWISVFSQTTIPANTSLRGTLTKSASPYYVKGNVFVPKDSTLIIEPGVQIRFDGKCYYSKHNQKNFN